MSLPGVAALALTLGAGEDELDSIWNVLEGTPMPESLSEARAMVLAAIERLRYDELNPPSDYDPTPDDSAAIGTHDNEPEPDMLDLIQRAPSGHEIYGAMSEVAETLLLKNIAYGDSALSPVRVFSASDPIEQLRVRVDDKLSRLARGHDGGEDVILDLIGYLVLLLIAERRQARG